jgi:hypothetical protein
MNYVARASVKNAGDELGLFAALRAAWGNQFRLVFSHRHTTRNRRERAALSVTDNSRRTGR